MCKHTDNVFKSRVNSTENANAQRCILRNVECGHILMCPLYMALGVCSLVIWGPDKNLQI